MKETSAHSRVLPVLPPPYAPEREFMVSQRGFLRKIAAWSMGALIVAGSLGVLVPASYSADRQMTPPVDPTAVSGPFGELDGHFLDIQKLSVGATAVMIPAVIPSAGGFGDVRYWFSNGIGIDGGVGFALPSVSPNISYAVLFNLEGMWAFVERPHLVIFFDFDALPIFFPLQNYTSTTMAFSLPVSLGVGIEHAFSEYPKATLYARLNPLSFNVVSAGAAGSSPRVGFDFLGTFMNMAVGIHFYGIGE